MFGEQTFAQLRTGFRQRSSPPWHVEDPVPRPSQQVGPPGVEADQWAHQAAESEQCRVSLSMYSFTSPSHWSACLTHQLHINCNLFSSQWAICLSMHSSTSLSRWSACLPPHFTSSQPRFILPTVGNSILLLITGKAGKYYASLSPNLEENSTPEKTACADQIHRGIKRNLLLRGALFNFFWANSKTL